MALLGMGRCIPAGMELFGAAALPPWEYITRVLDVTDYFVLVFGSRYGSSPPDGGASYTEREYDYAVENKIPVLAFVPSKERRLLEEHIETDHARREALREFRNKVEQRHLVTKWSNPTELAQEVTTSLWREFHDTPRPGWVRGVVGHTHTHAQTRFSGGQTRPRQPQMRDEPEPSASRQDAPPAEQPNHRDQSLVIAEALKQQISRDPLPKNQRGTGHLHVVAEPTASMGDAAWSFVRGPGASHRLVSMAHAANAAVPAELAKYEPSILQAGVTRRTSRGISLLSYGITRSQELAGLSPDERRSVEKSMVAVEVRENGSVGFTVGRLVDSDRQDRRWVLDGLAVVYVLHACFVSAEISAYASYDGPWAFGVAADGLLDAPSSVTMQDLTGLTGQGLDEDEYRRITVVDGSTLRQDCESIVDRLVGSLLDVLGTRERFLSMLHNAG
jgi:hypothetical protein